MRGFARLSRRLLAVAGATLVGAFGAVAFAVPASANNATLTYDVACADDGGKTVVTWTVNNKNNRKAATVSNLSKTLDGDLKNDAAIEPNSSVSGTESVDAGAAREATLTLHIEWSKNAAEDLTATADLLKCKKPTATFTDNCDGTTSVHVENTTGIDRRFAVNGTGDFVVREDLVDGEKWDVTVPAANAERTAVKMRNLETDELDRFADHHWAKPKDCGVPTVTTSSTCDDLVIKIVNPADGKAFTATVTAGDEKETFEVKADEEHTVTITASAGLVAKLTIGDKTTEHAYDEPATCVVGGLPVTGADAGMLAGAALVLVSGGAGLFYAARRRRIRFAA